MLTTCNCTLLSTLRHCNTVNNCLRYYDECCNVFQSTGVRSHVINTLNDFLEFPVTISGSDDSKIPICMSAVTSMIYSSTYVLHSNLHFMTMCSRNVAKITWFLLYSLRSFSNKLGKQCFMYTLCTHALVSLFSITFYMQIWYSSLA